MLLTDYQKKKLKNGKCVTRFCRNDRAKDRTICHKCRMRKYKERHPVEYAFQNLRANARRRGKVFTLTIEYFKEFCENSNYIQLCTKKFHGFHIDRIDESRGYEPGNIQLLTNSENVKKYNKYSSVQDDCPF